MSKSTVLETLSAIKVSTLPVARQKVIEIDSKTRLEAAFMILIDNSILSAPVYDAEAKKYLGFLDVRDLVAFAVFASKENELVETLQQIVLSGTRLHQKAQDGVTVTYLCRRNPFKPVKEDATLLDACRILATGTHRVPVVGANGRVTNIISQSSVISVFLSSCKEDTYLKKSILELRLGSSPVMTVLETDSALATFTKLDDAGRSGLAVVNAAGSVIGNISSSDIKLYLKHKESLQQPIIEFLNKIRRMDITTTRSPVFTCKPDDSVFLAIGKLQATKAHRVFVVDEKFRPTHVVSLTDIVRVILSEK